MGAPCQGTRLLKRWSNVTERVLRLLFTGSIAEWVGGLVTRQQLRQQSVQRISRLQVTLGLILGVAAGLLLGWRAPLLLWPGALVLVALWLGRWPRPGVWLLAATFGVIAVIPFAQIFVRTLEPTGKPSAFVRNVSSTPQAAAAWRAVEQLLVRNTDGNITVTGGNAWRLRARYRWGAQVTGVPDALLTAQRGQTLDFTGLEPAWDQTPLRAASAQLRAGVPRRVALSVDARSGDVTARNLASAHVNTNLGNVTLSSIAGAAVALTDVGNVFISDAGGSIEAKTLMGDIWLEPRPSDGPPAPILAQADVGDIALLLPPGTDARIMATSVSRQLPKNFKRLSPTESELVLGQGSRLIVLKTRVGAIRVVQGQ